MFCDHEKMWNFSIHYYGENFGVPQFQVYRRFWEMGFILVNRYLHRVAYWRFREKVTEGKMRKYDFSENPIRPHVKFRPQNDPLRADLPTWAPECRVMGSLGLFVPNYKKLDWTDFVLWPWENMKFLHSLLWEKFGVPKFHVYRRFWDMGFIWVNRYLDRVAYWSFRKKVTEGKMRK